MTINRGIILLWGALSLAGLVFSGCRLDPDEPAPFAEAPGTSACASTDGLFARMEAFIEAGRFEPLKEVIEDQLIPSPDNPRPDPSWRSVVRALIELIEQLGIDETTDLVALADEELFGAQLGPLATVLLQFVDGQVDGVPHYEAADATAFFIAQCDADDLLSSIEGILRLERPTDRRPWAVAVLEAASPLLTEPTFVPFLESFEENAGQGRPAIVSLLGQIMLTLAREDFEIGRIQALLDSTVYSVIEDDLRFRIQRMVDLLAEATHPEAGILAPLQASMRCGNRYPESRDVLLGFAYDVLISEEIGLVDVLQGAEVLESEVVQGELTLLSDVTGIVRRDPPVRQELLAVISLFLSSPHVQKVVPVLEGLLEARVVGELISAVLTLLEGCDAPMTGGPS